MSNLTIKQKIILGVIIGIMLTVIGIYGYISLHSEEEIDIGQMSSNEVNTNNQASSNNEAVSKNSNSVSQNAINSTIDGNAISRKRQYHYKWIRKFGRKNCSTYHRGS